MLSHILTHIFIPKLDRKMLTMKIVRSLKYLQKKYILNKYQALKS